MTDLQAPFFFFLAIMLIPFAQCASPSVIQMGYTDSACSPSTRNSNVSTTSGICFPSAGNTSLRMSCTANTTNCIMFGTCGPAFNVYSPTRVIPCDSCDTTKNVWLTCSEDRQVITAYLCGCANRTNCPSRASFVVDGTCNASSPQCLGEASCPVQIRSCPTTVTASSYSDRNCQNLSNPVMTYNTDTCANGGQIFECAPAPLESYIYAEVYNDSSCSGTPVNANTSFVSDRQCTTIQATQPALSSSQSCVINTTLCIVLADCTSAFPSTPSFRPNLNVPTENIPCNSCYEQGQLWVDCNSDGSSIIVFSCGCQQRTNCSSSFTPSLGGSCPSNRQQCANGDPTKCPVALRRCPSMIATTNFSSSSNCSSLVTTTSTLQTDTCLAGGLVHRCVDSKHLPTQTPQPTPPPSPLLPQSSGTSLALIVGATVGGSVALILGFLAAFWFCVVRPRNPVSEASQKIAVGEELAAETSPTGLFQEEVLSSSKNGGGSGTDSRNTPLTTVAQVAVKTPRLSFPVSLARFASYERLNLVGRGASGSVYRCSLPNGKLFALKEILLPTNHAPNFVQLLLDEVALVASLDHPNLVKYYASAIDDKTGMASIFMEYVPNGSLGSLTRNMPEPIGEPLASKYLRQVLLGLQYLHDKSVMHRDIKCDNVLLASDGSAKITDFGAAKIVGADTMRGAQTMIGTPFFMAPEMLMGGYGDETDDQETLLYGKRADIWSLGIMTLELLERGNMPWPNMNNIGQLILHISTDGSLPIMPSRLSGECRDFVLKCCERSPQVRWRASELLSHPWITRYAPDELQQVESFST